MCCRTLGICTASVCGRFGRVQTAPSTCRSLHWSACSTRPPAGHPGNCKTRKPVRNQTVCLSLLYLFFFCLTKAKNNVSVNYDSLSLLILFVHCCRFSVAESSITTCSLSAPSLTRLYHCDVCDEDLTLSSTEILKHKRQHMASSK